jgi:hypothetical protein
LEERIARTGEKRNMYIISVRKSERNTSWKPRSRLENDLKIVVTKTGYEDWD